MEKVIEILKEIENTSSRKEKELILMKNKDNEKFKMILEVVFNKYKVFGIGEKSISIKGNEQRDIFEGDIFRMLEYLMGNNTGTNKDKDIVNAFLNNVKNIYGEEMFLWYKKIILKKLRIGLTDKTINKIYDNLIPTFDVMLAKKYEKDEQIGDEEIIVTLKLDGVRCVVFKDDKDGHVFVFTREGQPITGLVEIEKEFEKMPKGIVYDGEILSNKKGLHSKDLYRETVSNVRKKGLKTGLVFNCFDMLPVNEFKNGTSKEVCKTRKENLHNLIKKCNVDNNIIKEVEVLYIGKDKNKINEFLEKAIANGEEGVMVNIANKQYVCKRSSNLLKVKKFRECDLRIVGFEEGKGKFEGTLGRINVDYKGNIVGVGSGLTDEIRSEIWNNKEKYINKIAKISYFEETTNKNDDSVSLRFPTFEEIRFDKTEISYD